MITITQAVNLSLTDCLTPEMLHVKQYDHMSRFVECSIYNGGVPVSLDSSSVIEVSGTTPSGSAFIYDSETFSDIVYVSNGCACFWITSDMTAAFGKVPIDVSITDGNEVVIGSFSLVLCVEQAAVDKGEISNDIWGGGGVRRVALLTDSIIAEQIDTALLADILMASAVTVSDVNTD